MIRITRLTDYGIALLARMAEGEVGTVWSSRQLARLGALPGPTVSKLLKSLARQGLLISHRGTQGGYSLARPPAEISVAEIIRALEGPVALTECSVEGSDGGCDRQPTCSLSGSWQRITQAVLGALEAVPLTEMARSNGSSKARADEDREEPPAPRPDETFRRGL